MSASGDIADFIALGSRRHRTELLRTLFQKTRDAGGDLFADFVRFAGTRGLAGAAGLIAIGGLLEGLGILLLLPLLGILFDGGGWGDGTPLEPISDLLQANEATARLLVLLGIFTLLIATRALVLIVRASFLARLQHGFVASVRLELIRRASAAPWQKVATLEKARIVNALSTDIPQIGLAAHYILQSLVAVVLLIAHCIVAFALAPAAAGIALALLMMLAVAGRKFLLRARSLGDTLTKRNLQMTEGSIRFMDGLKLAAAQNLQGGLIDQYEVAADAGVRDRVAFSGLQATLLNLSTSLAALVGGLTILLGLTWLHVAPAVLVTLILVLSRMLSPAMLLQQGAQNIVHSLPAYRTVRSLIDELPADAGKPASLSRAQVPVRACALALCDATFFYRGGGDAGEAVGVRQIDLSIPAGSLTGVSGPSGAGKTTFVDLLAGLLEPRSGAITVDGIPLRGESLRRHRDRIAYVGQDPLLFGGTVRDNLAWACPSARDDAMWEALAVAGADRLVRRLDRGLDGRIGERGSLLSAGERQRLALARALLRRPSLLLLDEATHSIDLAGERAIFERLGALTPRPTILLVSHRPESLSLCSRILAFANGRLVQDTVPAGGRPVAADR